jgi:hypothetical protein
MMEALSSSETSVLTRTPWRNIPEDPILHSHRRKKLKSYIARKGICRHKFEGFTTVTIENGLISCFEMFVIIPWIFGVIEEPAQLSRYSDWLRAQRPSGRSSIKGVVLLLHLTAFIFSPWHSRKIQACSSLHDFKLREKFHNFYL